MGFTELPFNWIGATLSIVGIALNANKLITCWPVWIASNFFWLAYSLPQKDWAYVVLWVVFVFFNSYGWYQWLSKKGEAHGS